MTPETFDLRTGHAPLLISIPHLGTHVPAELLRDMTPEAAATRDTDWHLDRLYEFAHAMGATVLAARVSRYAIDLNRPPGGESLYPGMTTTGLCPLETFRGEPLYKPGRAPDSREIQRRRKAYWQPYHDVLRDTLAGLRARHGQVLLWEAHSIAGVLPRLFDSQLPDLNFGTNSGASCAPAVTEAVLDVVRSDSASPALSHVLDGRFKGGFITRHYGRPASGIHAIQLEMRQALYMHEEPPFGYLAQEASRVQGLLQHMLARAMERLRRSA